ncbi:dephospho-CoA kinase [Anaerocolumna xylanovorans DSM 12503]|uniref:Dephospho-CoA kinase n=2 Tax=Anaerocolumna TaxID=1843210 RepID=A0A1M7YB35_9FIRM|nr:dephospho-CoA kinase [Anaerocolumna xylanovorans DSM 12503]
MKQNKEVKVIGLTGGIGSGKSEAARILVEAYGALLLNTDRIAHDFMEKGGISYELIVEYFGKGILDAEGKIDRGKLGREVYQNPAKLKVLNSFTHPPVMEYVRNKIKEAKEGGSYPFICVETALPREAALDDFCDEIWYVNAEKEVRKERLQNSRNFNSDKFEQVLKNQFSEEEYKKISTHILTNNDTLENLKDQIDKLL